MVSPTAHNVPGFDPKEDELKRLRTLLEEGSEECCQCMKDGASVATPCCRNFFCFKCLASCETCPICQKELNQKEMITATEDGKKQTETAKTIKFGLSAKLKFLVTELRRYQVRDHLQSSPFSLHSTCACVW